jgi:peptidoglycan hydrolase-like protein with peptidoglycan-binding domain
MGAGTGRPRVLAGVIALACLAMLIPAAQAAAAKKHRPQVHRFGSRQLGPGAKGKDVRFLQNALTRLGIATGVDGVYGKATFKAVESLESQKGWPVNGLVSKKDAGRIRKLLAKASVSSGYFVEGATAPQLLLHANRAGPATVRVVNSAGGITEESSVGFSSAGTGTFTWNGIYSGGAVPDGTYQLKLTDPGTAKASVIGGQTRPFAMHLHAFPVPSPHNFGGADARFGAPRAGHTHQGQDIPAACGQTEVAFETGTLKVNAYQAGGAGYYIVIHGALSGTDAVYMHLNAPSPIPAGTAVTAGELVGHVGDTGDAQGCHLHFERWSAPGWYVGGAAYDPLPELTYWDTYS